MACILANAQKMAPAPGPCNSTIKTGGGWNQGGVSELCTNHYDTIKALIEDKSKYDFGNFINDYIRLFALMSDKTLVQTQLKALNKEMESKVLLNSKGVHSAYGKLSTALNYYESRCWFPNIHIVLIGLLPNDDYLKVMKGGYMPKDVGAGGNHGEFSHRLQWHAVMRVATKDFTTPVRAGWQHSPYQMYVQLGQPDEVARGVWGVIFDGQGQNAYRDPSVLQGDLTASGTGSGLELIGAKVGSTFRKRMKVEDAAMNMTMPDAKRLEIDALPTQAERIGAKKAFSNEALQTVVVPSYKQSKGFKVTSQEKELLEELGGVRNLSMPRRVLRHITKDGYELMMGGMALIRSGEQMLTDSEIDIRTSASVSKMCSETYP